MDRPAGTLRTELELYRWEALGGALTADPAEGDLGRGMTIDSGSTRAAMLGPLVLIAFVETLRRMRVRGRDVDDGVGGHGAISFRVGVRRSSAR